MLYFTCYPAVTPTAGALPGLKAFVAAVFGGIGSVPGAVIGAFIIGICENLIKSTDYTVFSDAFTFALLIIILCSPTGLFGERPRTRSEEGVQICLTYQQKDQPRRMAVARRCRSFSSCCLKTSR